MPVGSPTKQTIATKKYENKVGIVAKSYKLRRELVDRFASACEKEGISQAAKLTELMEKFCEKVEKGNLG